MTDRPMDVKLNEAVDRRIKREDDFIDDIISQINLAIESLDECDPSNARSAIDLTKEQLSEIIFKLNDVTNMTKRTASVANIVKDHQLMRRPNALPQSPQTVQIPPPPQAQVQKIERPAPLPINTAVSQEQAFLPGKNGVPPLISLPTRRPPTPPSSPPSSKPVVKPGMGGRRTRRKRKTRR